jgi:hypothetical protein
MVKILSLEQVLSDQEDLRGLCADRELVTREIFQWNDFYGNATILKLYARLPQSYPLKIVIPHAISFSATHMAEGEARFPLPVVHCYPQARKAAYLRSTRKLVLDAAAPFLYVRELLADQAGPNRSGTIFFPSHSTHHIEARYSVDEIAVRLRQLDEKYAPITICLYWRDVNAGLQDVYARHGFRVVSAGHIYDPLFQFRLFHLCTMHRFSASSELTSAMFFSIAAGCQYAYIPGTPTEYVADPETLTRDHPAISSEFETSLRRIFMVGGDGPQRKRDEAARFYLGEDFMMTRSRLFTSLMLAEVLDKVGYLRMDRPGVVTSPWLVRTASAVTNRVFPRMTAGGPQTPQSKSEQ